MSFCREEGKWSPTQIDRFKRKNVAYSKKLQRMTHLRILSSSSCCCECISDIFAKKPVLCLLCHHLMIIFSEYEASWWWSSCILDGQSWWEDRYHENERHTPRYQREIQFVFSSLLLLDTFSTVSLQSLHSTSFGTERESIAMFVGLTLTRSQGDWLPQQVIGTKKETWQISRWIPILLMIKKQSSSSEQGLQVPMISRSDSEGWSSTGRQADYWWWDTLWWRSSCSEPNRDHRRDDEMEMRLLQIDCSLSLYVGCVCDTPIRSCIINMLITYTVSHCTWTVYSWLDVGLYKLAAQNVHPYL